MGANYTTAKAKFVDDFIYQPPWEMAMAALSKKDTEIGEQLDTMEILRNLSIDTWEGDKGRTQEIQDKYESQVDSLTAEMQKDVLNPNNKYTLKNIQRELQKNISDGNIYKIQENAKKFREFEEKLKTIKDPATREMYKQKIEEYKRNNAEGAYTSIFDYGELYQNDISIEDFLGSNEYKALESRKSQNTNDISNKRYIMMQTIETDGVAGDRIKEAYKLFINNDPNKKAYMKDVEKYSEMMNPGQGKKYFRDEKVEFIEPGYELTDTMSNLGIYSTDTESRTLTKKGDPYGTMAAQDVYNKRLYEYKNSNVVANSPFSHNEDMSWFFENSELGRKAMVAYEGAIAKIGDKILYSIPVLPGTGSLPMSMIEIETMIRENGGPLAIAELDKLQKGFNDEMAVGTERLARMFPDKKTLKEVQTTIHDPSVVNAIRLTEGNFQIPGLNLGKKAMRVEDVIGSKLGVETSAFTPPIIKSIKYINNTNRIGFDSIYNEYTQEYEPLYVTDIEITDSNGSKSIGRVYTPYGSAQIQM